MLKVPMLIIFWLIVFPISQLFGPASVRPVHGCRKLRQETLTLHGEL